MGEHFKSMHQWKELDPQSGSLIPTLRPPTSRAKLPLLEPRPVFLKRESYPHKAWDPETDSSSSSDTRLLHSLQTSLSSISWILSTGVLHPPMTSLEHLPHLSFKTLI